MEIDDSRIDYSEENESILKSLGTIFDTLFGTFLHFRNFTLLVIINKFDVVSSFRNSKIVDTVHICFVFIFFLHSKRFSNSFLFMTFPLLASLPILNNFLYPYPYAYFWEVLPPLTKGGERKLCLSLTSSTTLQPAIRETQATYKPVILTV